ncbi:phosphatidylglycerophosphatase A [Oceanospirillum multiglobuliferum]|uniref:Phosphatidylglycerophosphatase A n=1 Tax=Oceanospirillum multiglobuliferum TaxID=64969 RepID=A0A1T4S3D1_9GAMM|nr:phosphatidylglycerophosphatase A [Oceanospirillum multiglobuliferum]OPX54504.1 phosphatidylglycerophosphatase A [Oceanospirillum multiglobuliferum]SKA22735.1 phosphatidylglycerophosphatase A [Oceanospirillum multiglobuliferum]
MNRAPSSVWRNPVHFLAFGLGSGAAPWAPGTVGTALAVVPYLLWLQQLPILTFSLIIAISFVVGVWLCEKTSQDLGVHDHSGIVWDEFVGYWLTMLMAPPGWQWALVGFILFRFFDVLKPWPVKWADRRVAGGFGIMFDDLLAGIYAWLVLQIIARLV